jgi:hypothetical protein
MADLSKLENIISGYRVNDDDAAWLRAAARKVAAQTDAQPAVAVTRSGSTMTIYVNGAAALSVPCAQPAVAAVPEGWVRVPKVPTAGMIEASTCGPFSTARCKTVGDERRLLRRQWAAMLSAAPAAPEVE